MEQPLPQPNNPALQVQYCSVVLDGEQINVALQKRLEADKARK